MIAEELTRAPAAALASMVRERRASAVEVVDAHVRRIEGVNAAIGAVVALDAERALAAARACDEDSEDGPLRGVPFTVKDNIAAAGIEMAIGVRERAGVVPDFDATVVGRMRRAGAILLGKTNCPPYGGGIETGNEVHGRTSNPYDLDCTSGGSSGGEAAIVAACGSPCGLGTDSGASVRLPAHFCGLASLKPTAGLVPVTGVIDDHGQIGSLSDPRTQVGPVARAVGDIALVLRVVAGPDGRDGGVAPVPLGDPAGVRVPELRVAVCADHGPAPTAETLGTLDAAAATLRTAGASVERARHPSGGHELTIDVWRSYGGEMSAEDLYRVLRRWEAFRAEMLEFARGYDVVLSPVFPSAAVPHGTLSAASPDPTGFTTPYSLAGWPSATVRCGTSPDGLPIGVQVAARAWRDDVALAVALELERALGGWQPPSL